MQLEVGQRERQYSPSSRLPDHDLQPFLDEYLTRSDAARARIQPLTIGYGPRPANTIDLALPTRTRRPGASTPIHVFIHGGYWQELSKVESYFLAPACTGRGAAFAAVDYTLAPTATVSGMADECAAAIRKLRSVAGDHDLDPDRIVVSGSSAGAHLAALATLRLDRTERPRGLILVSGVYLLEPLVGTSINDAVGLDADSARLASPLLHDLSGFPPSVVAYGDDETDEFKRQSRALVDALTSLGVVVSEVEVPGRNHFDVVFDIVPDLSEILDLLAD